MCLPVTPNPPKERPFGLRDIKVFRVGQHCRHFGLCLFLRHGSWRKGNTRGRPERPPPRSLRCRLQTAACFCARTRVRARSFLCGSVLDAERRWPGAVREGWGCADGQSGCGRGAREIKTISKLSSKKFNKLLFFYKLKQQQRNAVCGVCGQFRGLSERRIRFSPP
jgi:hypothetical protein